MSKGTIRINSELMPMMPYGCHSDRAPDRFSHDVVIHGNGDERNAQWIHRMSTKCRFDAKKNDIRCNGCNQPYDDEYVESLNAANNH